MYTTHFALLPISIVILAHACCGHQQIELGQEKVGLEQSFMGLPEPHTREQSELLRDLHFVPSHLDFGLWSVGQARTQRVTLFNQHSNRTVQLNSVAGAIPVFYSSFFGTREVPPAGGNTTFNVVFLPRELGAISTDLMIHTSFGRAEFAVRGEGSECPYRLKPLVGIKAPLNATLTPEIHMYNPHERPLQILEVYSSGGEFQLELPSGGSEGPQNLWEIPPHTLKPVIRISFHGRTAGNHSAYIRIKIAEQELELEQVLVIPVEFEILPRQAAYARNPLADFGRLATQNAPEALLIKLDMQNEPEDPLKSQMIGSFFRDIPGLSYDANESSIRLDPKLFEQSETINDLLVIQGEEQKEQFTILVRAEIFKGGLTFDGNVTKFVTSSSSEEGGEQLEKKRSLMVTNSFDQSLIIYNVSLTQDIDAHLLEMDIIRETWLPLVLQPGESVELVKMNLVNEEQGFNSSLRIETNVTRLELPLVSCSGRLKVSTQPFVLEVYKDTEEQHLDLGTVPFGEMSRNGYIILRNDNPLPIKITNWFFKKPKNVYFHSTFMGCVHAQPEWEPVEEIVNVYTESERNETTRFHFCGEMGPGDRAVFKLGIQTYVAEPSVGTLKVWTPYELIRVLVKFKASVGQLDIEQDQLNFKNCFPGKICSAVLSIRSSFMQAVHVKSVSFTRLGLRFKDFNAKGSTIAPQTLTKVGRIYFEPAALCGNLCYIREINNEQAIFPSIPGGGFGGGVNNNLLYDGVELRQRTELYRQFKRQLQAMSLTLHSEELPPLELDFSISLEWPKLVQFQPIPPTPAIEVSQVQRQWITITNPTQQPLILDYFLSDPAFARRTQLSLPHEVIDVSSTSCYLTDKEVFSLPEAPFGGPLLLAGGASLTIPIQFSSQQADKFCTLLHVRSNLTLYEAVWLQAKAVQSQFRFGNRRPGSSTPLMFELSREQLEDCSPSSGVTTRSFTARNSGVIPLRVEGFLIGSQRCEDFGFKVLDCDSFDLGENETRKIEIAFSTDYTASRVQRNLRLITNLTYDINYVMLAQLPAESVEQCAARLTRPAWETSLRNTALVVLMVSFCLVLIAAIFDARAIMTQQNVYDAARYKGPVQPTFNLRNIVKQQAEEAALKAEAEKQQQQKIRNGQVKELRKRSSLATAAAAPRKFKPSSWSAWSMDLNVLKSKPKQTPTTTNNTQSSPPPPPAAVKKSSTPSPQAPSQPRPPKKAKQAPLLVAKPKPEPASATEIPIKPENISPRPTKTHERVLKEQNGSTKKLGKTPGREREKERRKEQRSLAVAATKKTERKQRQKHLNFDQAEATTTTNSPPASPDALKCITSPWETSSRVSFRDVLQTKQFPLTLDTNSTWNPSQDSSVANPQLGPIGGSRKNGSPPGLNSLWEPIAASSSNSLFASVDLELPAVNDLRRELEREREQQAQWKRSELIMQQQLLLQQELQQRQQQQEKLLLLANMEQNNWNTTSWSPLGYSAWPSQAAPTSVGPIRPPPGLESNYNGLNATAHNLAQEPGSEGSGQTNSHLPTQYDPFTSPSSIWSDNWRQSSQRNNNNNSNHMN